MAEAASSTSSHNDGTTASSSYENVQELGDVELPDNLPYTEIPEVQISADNAHELRIEIDDHSSLSLRRDENGHTILHIAAARTLSSVSDILEDRTASEAVILLSDKTPVEGWTSLHISTLKNNSDVVEYILDKVADEEQRKRFINEVDRELGWTSLQWGAAMDQVESVQATMDRMSLSHQQEVMTTGWTLLHATAEFNAVKTMETLMQRVELSGEEERWKILTCPTADGKTALHIAVIEGNERAAVMLLDLAGGSQSLSNQRDEHGRKAQSYSDRFSALGDYLALAEVAFEEPEIHIAARREDSLLMHWILNNYPGPRLEAINRRNIDGSTVLHVACEATRPSVIEMISKQLSQEEFLSTLKELNGEGQTAIHLATIQNCPASVHTILAAVPKSNRRLLLLQKNQDGINSLQIAKQREHLDVTRILKYHHLILSDGLRAFFHQFEYSLFSRPIPDENLKLKYKRIEHRMPDDRGLKRHVNSDATTCILHDDMDQAEALTKIAVTIAGNHIHTWCNRGILYLEKEDFVMAEQSAFLALELMASNSVTCQLVPKIEFAYWIAETLRTEQARDECCTIMEKCQMPASKDNETQEYLSYCFLKILIRQLRSDDKYKKPKEWYQKRLYGAIDQLVILWRSRNIQHVADMWLWLAELQYLNNVPMEYLAGPLQRFSTETEITNVDRESCYRKVIPYLDDDDAVKLEDKMRARIAKNCLDIAYNCEGDPREWYTRAVVMSEKWMEDHEWVHMCASTCAHGLYNLWAIEFYKEHRDLVRRKYKQLNGIDIDSPKQAWSFLITYFYSAEISEDVTTRRYLGEAKEHLARITDRDDGWVTHGVKYAKIKFLLGDTSVEEVFIQAISAAENNVWRAKAQEHFGCYYLAIGSYEQAKFHFRMAIKEGKNSGKSYRARASQSYLRWINKTQTPRHRYNY